MQREQSDERTKLAAPMSLKGDASLLKLGKSILPITLDSGTNTRRIHFAADYQKWWCLLNQRMVVAFASRGWRLVIIITIIGLTFDNLFLL